MTEKKPTLFSQYRGYHTHRFQDNPLEERFALAWQEVNGGKYSTLGYMFSTSNELKYVELEDAKRAATVIQWLGSPVGTNFLAEVLNIDIETIRESWKK
jgi:selenophosphate synthetase-related protein